MLACCESKSFLMLPLLLVLQPVAISCNHEAVVLSADGATMQIEDASESVRLLQKRVDFKSMSDGIDGLNEHVEMSSLISTVVDVIAPPVSAANVSGVKLNGEGDLSAFLSTLVLNVIMSVCFITAGAFFRRWYDKVYIRNVQKGVVPTMPSKSFFGWASASLSTSSQDAGDWVGLDHGMLIEFHNLGMRMMTAISIPMVVIMGPLHCYCGGNAAGGDHMSYLSMGNVQSGSWLYWVHMIVVWLVCFIVVHSIFGAQETFMRRRVAWLKKMPAPRCTTVLVEGIPENLQSDAELKRYFEKLFSPNSVVKAYVVKRIYTLMSLCRSLETVEATKKDAEARWASIGNTFERRPKDRWGNDILDQANKDIASYREKIKEERLRLRDQQDTVGGINATAGFVTFSDRATAEVAQSLQYKPDSEELVVSVPPQPECILWSDLMENPHAATLHVGLGYALVVGLYILYMPIVIFITNLAETINMGPFQPLWKGFAPSLGLTIMVSFLPTILMNIFSFCFILKDANWAQQKLQNWYFAFQVVFVILVTAIGTNFWQFIQTIIKNPLSLPLVFAKTMPGSTHFYINYLILQCNTHFLQSTRYIQLIKFLSFKRFYEEEEAADKADLEDQDYYGMGGRTARQTINLCIGIVFCTLSPPLGVVCLLLCFVQRLVYGYLMVFAEPVKPDLGGYFWVAQLKHLFVGLFIYTIVMSGVLAARAPSNIPGVVSACSIIFIAVSLTRFNRKFCWESLPYEELIDIKGEQIKSSSMYVQKELEEPYIA